MRTLLTMLLLLASFNLNAKDIKLLIDHTIGGEEILDGEVYQLVDVDFKFTRLHYYLSNFTLIDDQGNETDIEDSYLLIDYKNNEYSLGDIDVENVDKIRFYIGIDSDANHSDPTDYPEGHPLNLYTAPMHWGWAAGYRFVAVEGFCKDIFQRWNNEFQFHLVGNKYFTPMELDVEFEDNGNELVLSISPDILDMLEGVNLTTNNIIHGAGGSNDIIIQNMAKPEFFIELTSSVEDEVDNSVKLFIDKNSSTLNIESLIDYNSIQIIDINGRIINSINSRNDHVNISALDHGIYFISLNNDGQSIFLDKFIK